MERALSGCVLTGNEACYNVRYRDNALFALYAIGTCIKGMWAVGNFIKFRVCYRDVR